MGAHILSAEKRQIYFQYPGGSGRHGNAWYPELSSGDADCRTCAAITWKPLEISWSVGENQTAPTGWADALGFGKTIRGFETLVSESAREVLTSYIGGECQFLPVEIPGAPMRYFVLYVTRLLDCLDTKTTRFSGQNPFGPRLVSVPSFRSESLNGFLFRLMGGRGYQLDYDFATNEFIKLVRGLGLRGFKIQRQRGSSEEV